MHRFFQFGMLFLLMMAVFHFAHSASFNTGGGKKKESVASNSILHKHLKGYYPLSLSNGYKFRGSLNFSGLSGISNMEQQHNVFRFEKGNTMYVLPMRQHHILSKIRLGVHPAAPGY